MQQPRIPRMKTMMAIKSTVELSLSVHIMCLFRFRI
jgi:hypothetical protein